VIEPTIFQHIQSQLSQIEREENVQILFAVESGSRAWGFPSANSDYDVRFVYIHPRDWYLSVDLEHRRDVIERPCDELWDFAGWDIRKAFKLFMKSNPPLLEWLDSPFIYLERHDFASKLRALIAEFFSPTSSMHHYLHMARGNMRAYLQNDTVWVKKYFYVLRPILAVRWLAEQRGAVPMAFGKLLDTITDQPELIQTIRELLDRKMLGDELAKGPKIPAIHDFLTNELERWEAGGIPASERSFDIEHLNLLFREMLSECETCPRN